MVQSEQGDGFPTRGKEFQTSVFPGRSDCKFCGLLFGSTSEDELLDRSTTEL